MRNSVRVMGVLFCALTGALQAGEGLKSGPPVGDFLPGSFQPFNLNGKIGKNHYHCLVCEYGLDPTVMVFVRERPATKEPAVTDLLQKLDEAVERHRESYVHAFAVFLSPVARTSVTDPKTEDPSKLVDDAAAWESLLARLRPRADKLKNVVIAVYPAEGPKEYSLAKDADVTVVLYRRHKVVANYAFAEGKLNEQGVSQVIQAVDAMAKEARKRPALAGKKT